MQDFLPRVLATVLLLVSLALMVPLVLTVQQMLRGEPVASQSWLFPLIILATGTALIYLLARKAVALQLYLAAYALWVLAAGYYFVTTF